MSSLTVTEETLEKIASGALSELGPLGFGELTSDQKVCLVLAGLAWYTSKGEGMSLCLCMSEAQEVVLEALELTREIELHYRGDG